MLRFVLKNQLAVLPVGGRSVAKSDYMVLLFRALVHLKQIQYTEFLAQIRFEMDQDSLFWKRTTKAYQKLLALEEETGQNLTSTMSF